MALDDCGQMSKCIVILFNIIIGIVGCAMLGLGVWLRFSSETRGFFDIDLNTKQFVIGVTVLIVLGIILLLLSFLGHCGACSGNRSALGVYASLLVVLAGVIIAAGVLAFINSDEVGQQLAAFYKAVYLQYINKGGEQSLAVTLKLFHNALGCCGIGLPLEVLIQETCSGQSILNTPGCPSAIETLFRKNAGVMLGCFLGTAAVMICALVCGIIMSQQLKRYRLPVPIY
ncbi:hypothetical protein SKAU_G00293930 [Synaphobranchus kaupii]|uniref:Tetraspanin n=1 Tax=Synaphobranchus kaupii TaxID=118154 RepID=A0A9Q1EUC9_SYNKA|nr:hypothetical protein SKAU_G00293930 [Synaphobranchus kaupii]